MNSSELGPSKGKPARRKKSPSPDEAPSDLEENYLRFLKDLGPDEGTKAIATSIAAKYRWSN